MMNFGTIGTSWVTEKFIKGALNTGKWKLSAVYSRELEKGKKFAKQFQCQSVHDDMIEMVKEDFDTVYIASPNSLHYEQIKYFVSHHKNVICEKPIVMKIEQLYEVFEMAEDYDVFVIEAFRHINSPGFDVLSCHLDKIQPIRNVTFSYNQYSSRYGLYQAGQNPNAFNPAFGGGALMDLGVYPLSLAVALWGKPKKHIYMPLLLPNGADGVGTLVLDYADFLCNITFSKLVEGYIQNEILGEQGAIILDRASELKTIDLLVKGKEKVNISVEFYENDMQHEAEIFYHIIKEGNLKLYNRLKDISIETTKIISSIRG